jgi:glycosyltransferase involved in cell wall biosynthesis
LKRKPVLTIFYQFNPWHSTIGGIQSLIGNFIKYAPSEFEVRLVGTGVDKIQPTLEWQVTEFAGKEISFLPLLNISNDNVRSFIPTTIKYTSALMGRCFASDFMHFHRLEPTFASRNWLGEKTLFIHNDIQTQVLGKGDRKAIGWRQFPAAYFAMERYLLPQFREILSCNSNAVKFYQERYPLLKERVAYVKNTYDDAVFYPLSKEERDINRRELARKLGLAETTRFILFAGRLHPQKDPLLLVRSLAALNERDVHLLIAGDGELAGDIRSEIAWLGQSKRVTMLGSLPAPEVAKLHRLSNVCVLTSKYEGLPLVVLEALASGTPVVTTKCGETPNFLTPESGIVCSESTVQGVASALAKVLKHPESFLSDSCLKVVSPYAASKVVNNIYTDMFKRWEMKQKISLLC